MLNFKSFSLLLVLLLNAVIWGAAPVQAFETASGQFVAGEACEALQSIQKRTNPGNITLKPQAAYEVVGKNRKAATHYMIRVVGAKPESRWVPTGCGQLRSNSSTPQPANPPKPQPTDPVKPKPKPNPNPPKPPAPQPSNPANGQSSQAGEFLLALSWQPSFCETRPNKPECVSQTSERFDATNLVLHGLWPQPQEKAYCGVSARLVQLDKDRRWSELPPLELSAATRQALETRMPGMASHLDRHEWYKHGTCYSNTPEEYFQESIALLDQVNRSDVQTLLASNINFLLTDTEIQQAFNESFGTLAGEKIAVKCARDPDENQEIMVVELWLNLKGKIEPNTPLRDLLQAAPRARRDCRQGEIDPAGFGNG